MSENRADKTSSKWDVGDNRKAVFSPCRKWRYHIEHVWDDAKPNLLWLMLNPSTADEKQNDPTVERCERRARMWGFGGFEVYNIFAFRATDPANMKAQTDPIGADNDAWMIKFAKKSRETKGVLGWGEHGKHLGRGAYVLDLLRAHDAKLYALKLNASGHPKHPLYVGYKQGLIEIPPDHSLR